MPTRHQAFNRPTCLSEDGDCVMRKTHFKCVEEKLQLARRRLSSARRLGNAYWIKIAEVDLSWLLHQLQGDET
jgi:hypothetical protein